QVPLADRGGIVAVQLKNLRDGRRAGRPIRAVPRPTSGYFSNRSEADRMMVTPRQQCCARGRAKSRDVEPIVTQSCGRQFVECWGRDGSAERRRISKPGVVN